MYARTFGPGRLKVAGGSIGGRYHSIRLKSGSHQNEFGPNPPKVRRRRFWGIVAALGVAAYVGDDLSSNVFSRGARAIVSTGYVTYQYSRGYEGDVHELHERSAELLYDMIQKNKGLYIKLGQAVANQGQLFPIEFQRKFAKLYDKAPVDDWSAVDRLLRENLGSNYEADVFEYIDHTPVALASIAQVHKAVLRLTGEQVAVKVQHPYIQKQIGVDLLVYRLLTKINEIAFDLPMASFLGYVLDQMIKESDFVNEQKNADRLAQRMAKDSDLSLVVVPKTYPHYTTKQVLITEWVEGVSLLEKDRLVNEKWDVRQLLKLYMKAFGRQMFDYGFVHSDPHPGNLIARKRPDGKEELVILDHGLYIDLPPDFRHQYAQLWEYIFLFNREGIKKVALNWGVNKTDFFATFVQLRPIDVEGTNSGDARENMNSLLKDFLSDKEKFPKPLIFMSRTMRMMQSLNKEFGSPVNRVGILTKELVRSLQSGDWWQLVRFIPIRLVLMLNDVAFLLIRIRQYWLSKSYGKGAGAEDLIEDYMKDMAKSAGMEWLDEESEVE